MVSCASCGVRGGAGRGSCSHRGPSTTAACGMLLLPAALPPRRSDSSVLAAGVLHPGLLSNARLTAGACAKPRLTADACAPRGPFNDVPRSSNEGDGVALASAPGPRLLTVQALRCNLSAAASVHAAVSNCPGCPGGVDASVHAPPPPQACAEGLPAPSATSAWGGAGAGSRVRRGPSTAAGCSVLLLSAPPALAAGGRQLAVRCL